MTLSRMYVIHESSMLSMVNINVVVDIGEYVFQYRKVSSKTESCLKVHQQLTVNPLKRPGECLRCKIHS